MNNSVFIDRRKSQMDIGSIYFWTATINKWQHLLKDDNFKNVIVSSFEYLTTSEKIDVFAFVIMPTIFM